MLKIFPAKSTKYISLTLDIFSTGSYWLSAINTNCPTYEVIGSARECAIAAERLMLAYSHGDMKVTDRPTGCYTTSPTTEYGTEVFFNNILDPSSVTPNMNSVGVCKQSGRNHCVP